jgi:uncharacterized protein (DUF302 family)
MRTLEVPTVDAIETTIDKDLAETEAIVRRALSSEGFGVLTEIDVAATLRAKLGVERRALKILGACNPSLAHRALVLDPAVALVLPCNVVLEDLGESRTRVAIADPRTMLGAFVSPQHEQLEDLGTEAAAALEKVVSTLDG